MGRLYYFPVVTLPCKNSDNSPAKRAMNKSRQKELTRWLKQQSVISQRWLNISRLLGFVSGILIIAQAWFMARILQHVIMENIPREALLLPFTLLVLTFVLRAWVVWLRERVGYHAGQHIRFAIRRQVLDRLQQAGPAWIQGKPAGSWATLVLEQIDDMHDYYARYLPQMALAVSVPLLIVVAIFPSNWAAALILLGTAPLIPLFMALVGMGAADANRRNFLALARLSGHFLDRLRGMETLRILVVVKPKLKAFVLLRKISVNGRWRCCDWHFYPPAFWNSSPRCQLLWWRSTLVSPTSVSWILVTTILG